MGPPAAHEFDLGLDQTVGLLARGFERSRHLRHGIGEVRADEAVEVGRQQLRCGAVRVVDTPVGVEADDAGRNAGKHGLDEAPSGIDLMVRLDHLAPLALELAGHAVEGAAQGPQLVARRPLGHPRREVPRPHPLGGGDQAADRPCQLVGEEQTDPDRRQEPQQSHHHEDHGEGDLETRAALFELFVFADRALGAFHVAEHLGIHEPADVKERIDEPVETHQGAHAVVVVVDDEGHLAVPGLVQGPVGYGVEFEDETHHRARKEAAAAIEHNGFLQRADDGLGRHEFAEALGILQQRRSRPVEVVGHGEHVGADHLLMFVKVGFGNLLRLLKRRAHPLVEPRFDAQIEKQGRENGDENGRRHRHQAEHDDEADMQP